MATLLPFRAFRPRTEIAAEVACVPYDVINTEEARALSKGKSKSFLRVVRSEIDLPDDTSPYSKEVYEKASKNFEALCKENSFVREDTPSVYLYRLTMNGRSQTGVVGCYSLDEYDNGKIKIHEKTRPDKEDDRLRHILTLRAQAEPVFLAFQQQDSLAALIACDTESDPLYDFTSVDGIRHTLWRATDPEAYVASFRRIPELYIADGHHRSKSASRARETLRAQNPNHRGDEAYNFVMAVSFPHSELKIMPYNRVILRSAHASGSALREKIGKCCALSKTQNPEPSQPGEVCLYLEQQWYRMTLPLHAEDTTDPVRSLDVSRLQNHIFEPLFGIQDPRTDKNIDFIGGIRGTQELESLVRGGRAVCAFSLYPVTIEQLFSVANAGLLMPPKSTWFEPKLRSGLFVHGFD